MTKKVKRKKKVLLAVSGGVDSAVAAKLLLDSTDYEVYGVFLRLWQEKPTGTASKNKTSSDLAEKDADQVCASLGIPFISLNFSQLFYKEIVGNFINDYAQGLTPNPCVRCNKKIKLGALLDYALAEGFDYLATGHYVQIEKLGRSIKLKRGRDKDKDQSYFLYNLSAQHLRKLLFPLGALKKAEVRKIAEQASLPVASKRESQEICFISGKRHNDFLKKHLSLKAGEIRLWPQGDLLGQHQGLALYTIGQRRGIEIGGTGPYYVAKFDYSKNILYVVKNFSDSFLYKSEMIVRDINWINKPKLSFPFKTEVVIRYQHPAVKCLVDYDVKKKEARIKFFRRQRAITSGQSAVFYDKDEVLGGGIIAE